MELSNKKLELIYKRFNKREFVHPDPLEFLYNYNQPEDVEIVAFIASSLAYGRVAQILKSVKIVLEPLGKNPHNFLKNVNPEYFKTNYKNFKHRFTTAEELIQFLNALQILINKQNTLGNAYKKNYSKNDKTTHESLTGFIKELKIAGNIERNSLIADPEMGSACKRQHLFLRWLVRKDDVDLGIWNWINSSQLIIPLDTHMMFFAQKYNLTVKKNSSIKRAIEITENLKKINPKDPVKYDFSITRFGIRDDLNWNDFEGI